MFALTSTSSWKLLATDGRSLTHRMAVAHSVASGWIRPASRVPMKSMAPGFDQIRQGWLVALTPVRVRAKSGLWTEELKRSLSRNFVRNRNVADPSTYIFRDDSAYSNAIAPLSQPYPLFRWSPITDTRAAPLSLRLTDVSCTFPSIWSLS